jgi:hypothetical protein
MANKIQFNPLSGKFDFTNDGKITVDTKANILATTASSGLIAYATDVERFYYADGTSWFEAPIALKARSANPNMGAEQDEGLSGYGYDYITDKNLDNCLVKGNARSVEGAIRTSATAFQIYLNGVWNDIVINFRFREESGSYELEHNPVGLTWWYEVSSGNSNYLGLNGLPLIQQYSASMGAFPCKLIIDGGDFTS